MFYQDFRSRLASTLLMAVLLAACSAHSTDAAAANPPAPAPAAAATQPAPVVVRGLPDFTGLVESVGAAVVNVAVVEKARNNAHVNPFGDDEASAWPPSDPAAYAAFVAYLAQRYGTRLASIEVWNEPDQSN